MVRRGLETSENRGQELTLASAPGGVVTKDFVQEIDSFYWEVFQKDDNEKLNMMTVLNDRDKYLSWNRFYLDLDRDLVHDYQMCDHRVNRRLILLPQYSGEPKQYVAYLFRDKLCSRCFNMTKIFKIKDKEILLQGKTETFEYEIFKRDYIYLKFRDSSNSRVFLERIPVYLLKNLQKLDENFSKMILEFFVEVIVEDSVNMELEDFKTALKLPESLVKEILSKDLSNWQKSYILANLNDPKRYSLVERVARTISLWKMGASLTVVKKEGNILELKQRSDRLSSHLELDLLDFIINGDKKSNFEDFNKINHKRPIPLDKAILGPAFDYLEEPELILPSANPFSGTINNTFISKICLLSKLFRKSKIFEKRISSSTKGELNYIVRYYVDPKEMKSKELSEFYSFVIDRISNNPTPSMNTDPECDPFVDVVRDNYKIDSLGFANNSLDRTRLFFVISKSSILKLNNMSYSIPLILYSLYKIGISEVYDIFKECSDSAIALDGSVFHKIINKGGLDKEIPAAWEIALL